MKNTIVAILQQRMDKCTNEQFWATGAIIGLNAFLLSQNKTICLFFSSWAILAVSTVICIYGIFYVRNRHDDYYTIREAMAKLLRKEKNIPVFMTEKVKIWTVCGLIKSFWHHIQGNMDEKVKIRSLCSLIGLTFYSGLIVVGWIGVIIVYTFDSSAGH